MSKLLIISAGVSEDSNNTKLARKLNQFLNNQDISAEIYENLYDNIPFLLDNQNQYQKLLLDGKSQRIYLYEVVYQRVLEFLI